MGVQGLLLGIQMSLLTYDFRRLLVFSEQFVYILMPATSKSMPFPEAGSFIVSAWIWNVAV